jgi:apolipoprotein N-acyltransferase
MKSDCALSLALAALFVVAFRWPAPSGLGFHEVLAGLIFPVVLFWRLYRGTGLFWIWLGIFLGFAGLFTWLPRTLMAMGGLPTPLALLGAALFCAWEALGLTFVAWMARLTTNRRGPLAGALVAGLILVLWERFGYHIYPWSWGAAFGGLPILARSAAFLGTHGLAALSWIGGALTGAMLANRYRNAWKYALAAPTVMAALGLAWFLLPRGKEWTVNVVMVQPNFTPGVRRPGMEEECWALSDKALVSRDHPGTTLLLWPESSVLGRDDHQPNLRLAQEAEKRHLAWLFGTEGGRFNLLRGEVAGRPSFIQAKTEPMPFGERMPGPEPLRQWMDKMMGFESQMNGELTDQSSFAIPTTSGELKVHPVICSEALMSHRVLDGLAIAGGELITNHTNDGWFGDSIATNIHAAQIRLRAAEAGLPLLRATSTGRSGVFRSDGTWELWDSPLSQHVYRVGLTWRDVATPYRMVYFRFLLLAGLGFAVLLIVLSKSGLSQTHAKP